MQGKEATPKAWTAASSSNDPWHHFTATIKISTSPEEIIYCNNIQQNYSYKSKTYLKITNFVYI